MNKRPPGVPFVVPSATIAVLFPDPFDRSEIVEPVKIKSLPILPSVIVGMSFRLYCRAGSHRDLQAMNSMFTGHYDR